MPQSEFHRAVDIIQAALRPWLRSVGFRCRARTFNRVTDDGLTQVVGIQMGPFEPPGTIEIPGLRENLHGWFTVNLGVYVPEVAMVQHGQVPQWIAEYRCTVRTRLGGASGNDQDLWWRADPSTQVINDVRERLEVGGVPWLNRFASREQVLRELDGLDMTAWTNTPRVVSAIIRVARGETASARVLLRDQARETAGGNPSHASYVRRLADTLGVGPLDE
jgi:hypothetical protein